MPQRNKKSANVVMIMMGKTKGIVNRESLFLFFFHSFSCSCHIFVGWSESAVNHLGPTEETLKDQSIFEPSRRIPQVLPKHGCITIEQGIDHLIFKLNIINIFEGIVAHKLYNDACQNPREFKFRLFIYRSYIDQHILRMIFFQKVVCTG